jgi:transcriptional regulator with XRE-family HTH domain
VKPSKHIRAERRRAKLSQAELARRIGKSRSAVCEWEKALREPSLEDIRNLATALETTTKAILYGRAA